MPIYEYICLACEGRFDELMPMGAADPACPSCGERRVRRQPSSIALVGNGRSSGSTASSSGCACGGGCACGR
jgi:putative FmdB family regulatory protein